MEPKGWYRLLEDVLWLTQLGLSLLLPLVVCLWGCSWLTAHTGVGGWIYVPGFVVGLGCGAATFRNFARMMMKRAEKNKSGRPAGFNKH
ncbi:MAG: AtpZ/AtpI family protein [Gemmiger sp.]